MMSEKCKVVLQAKPNGYFLHNQHSVSNSGDEFVNFLLNEQKVMHLKKKIIINNFFFNYFYFGLYLSVCLLVDFNFSIN